MRFGGHAPGISGVGRSLPNVSPVTIAMGARLRRHFFSAAVVLWTIIPVFMAGLSRGHAPDGQRNVPCRQKSGRMMHALDLLRCSLWIEMRWRPENCKNCPPARAKEGKLRCSSRIARNAGCFSPGNWSCAWSPASGYDRDPGRLCRGNSGSCHDPARNAG